MIIEARGRRVTIRDGSSTQTYTFDTPDAALDFAADREDERLARTKTDLERLARYADPSHTADPVIPRPAQLLRTLAEIHNAEHPDDQVALPPGDDTGDEEELLARSLALLALVREGADIDLDALASSLEDDTANIADDLEDDDDSEDAGSGLVGFDFDYDSTDNRVKVTISSMATEQVTLTRTVFDPDGNEVRSGRSNLTAGRVLTRRYDLYPGQTIVFTANGRALDQYRAPNP